VISALCVGGFFVAAGLLVRPRRRHDEVHTTGTVSRSWLGWSTGQKTWRYTVEFRDTAGTVWTVEPPLSRGREQQVGTPVALAYRPDAPDRTARRTDGPDAYFHWILIGAGVVTAAVFPFMA
jgi:hypothetical protein